MRALAILLLLPDLAGADTVTIAADRDTTIYGESGDLSNGAGEFLFAGETRDGFMRRALVRFDVAAAIPAGSRIDAATVTLTLSRTRSDNVPVALYRVTASWGEGASDADGEEGAGAPATAGDATWTRRSYPTVAWTTAGGDHLATPTASLTVGKALGPYTWASAALATDVKAWLDAPTTNHGWIVIAEASDVRETKRFDSRQGLDAGTRPRLVVTFTPPAAAGACCADGVCTVAASPSACGGVWQGAGSMCTPDPCPQPAGACCLPDAAGTCASVSEATCLAGGGTFRGAGTTCAESQCPIVLEAYVDPLPRPPVATPTSGTAGGAATYRLAAVELTQKLHRDLPPTRVWGYDDGTGGSYPGPTIEASRDQPITVTWANDLRDELGDLRDHHALAVDACVPGVTDDVPRTVVHLHGGHVAAASDGDPEAAVPPGASTVFEYPNLQQAATLWYHDHALGITRLNVYMGLAGFYLLRDPVEAALGLPAGEDEVAIVIQDRRLAADGSLVYPATWQDEVLGDVVLVNGVVWPYHEVRRGKVRLRLLNGSNARGYRLSLSTGATLWVIGSDGGLLPAPVAVSTLALAPGERADVVVDLGGHAPGDEVLLSDEALPVMKLVVGSRAGHTAALPSTLRPLAALDEADALVTRDLRLQREPGSCGSAFTIDGRPFEEITERPALGTVEIWRFVNTTGVSHPMHLHLVQFQVLDRQPFALEGGVPIPTGPPVAPRPEEAGWKDTVPVEPMEMVRVIARFDDFVGRFPYHCHVLEHEDNAMMRQLETTTTCGDGARGLPVEECDDGGRVDGDGCSADCRLEGPPDDGGVPDAGGLDSGLADGGLVDGGLVDGGLVDGGLVDAGLIDAGLVDGGLVDAGLIDAGDDPGDPGGCGCRAGGAAPSGSLALLAIAAMLLRRRR